MARGANQKRKLLFIKEYLEKYSDKDHHVSVKDIITHLNNNDISAERKTIYADLDELRDHGLDIETVKTKSTGYYLENRYFELAEVKALVDSINASSFLPNSQTHALTNKLKSLCSVHQGKTLDHTIHSTDDLKTNNEFIFKTITALQTALSEHKKIRFKYFKYNVKKEREYLHDGKVYFVSPLILTQNNGFYYLYGYDEDAQIEKCFRLDRIDNIITTDMLIEVEKQIPKDKLDEKLKRFFSMHGGEETMVYMEFTNDLASVVIDRFGQNISLQKLDDERFKVVTRVTVSDQFFGWILGLGNRAKVTGPEDVKEKLHKYIKDILTQYE